MSLRAIRKREKENSNSLLIKTQQQQNNKSNIHLLKPGAAGGITTLSSSTTTTSNIQQNFQIHQPNQVVVLVQNLKKSYSYPEIKNKLQLKFTSKLSSKSETDLVKLNNFVNNNNLKTVSAKSEICLVKISSYETPISKTMIGANRNSSRSETNLNYHQIKNKDQINNNNSNNNNNNNNNSARLEMMNRNRRLSENSTYSSSTMTPNEYEGRGFADTSQIQIPIIGYEVMEERARFTVYKLRVENPFTNNCWLVLRRYTDFVRLNAKIKQLLPIINLQLPKKKIFGDNFNSVFLDNRVQGLQIFVNNIMSNEELRNSKTVRDFFCLDEAPTYSESMEEFRAIFEAQEETIAHLKLQVNSKNDLIISTQQKLMNEIAENERLKNLIRDCSSDCEKCYKNLEAPGVSNK